MPAADATETASLVVAGLVLTSAVFLGWRQWRDYRTRPLDLSALDQSHFRRQDLRRALGTIVLLLLALALFLGGRMPPRLNDRPNLKFVQVWSGAAFLIVVLLILALSDSLSTRLYARRHRARLTREGLSIVEAELRIKMELERNRELYDLPPDRN